MSRERLADSIKSQRGTLRADRHRNEPTGPPGAPAKPAEMHPSVEAFWGCLVTDLGSLGLLCCADGALIHTAALLLADRHDLRATIKELGPVYFTKGASGVQMLRARPEVAILDACERRLLAALAQLGLSPRARTSLDTTTTTGIQTNNPSDYF